MLIPGASGVGEVFRQVARELSARYQVVIYDRRGFSTSVNSKEIKIMIIDSLLIPMMFSV
jgi:hypothetical protein